MTTDIFQIVVPLDHSHFLQCDITELDLSPNIYLLYISSTTGAAYETGSDIPYEAPDITIDFCLASNCSFFYFLFCVW